VTHFSTNIAKKNNKIHNSLVDPSALAFVDTYDVAVTFKNMYYISSWFKRLTFENILNY